MRLAERSDDADREAQELSRLHGSAEQSGERLAAEIFEHEHGPWLLRNSSSGRAAQALSSSSFNPNS